MSPVKLLYRGLGLVILIGVVASCTTGGTSPAARQMSKISSCSGISTTGGDSLDDNTIDEGTCTLNDGTTLNIYMWAAGDESDLQQYVYWNSSSGNGCCIIGTMPSPWVVSLGGVYAQGYTNELVSTVEDALGGVLVTNPPSSWQYGSGTIPASQASPSSSPSPSPTPTPAPSAKVHHHHRVRHVITPPTHSAPPPVPSAWCRASAVYNAQYQDYDIYVHSNQPGITATATTPDSDNDETETQSYTTDSTGYADIYLYATAGNTVTVQVGNATCSTVAG